MKSILAKVAFFGAVGIASACPVHAQIVRSVDFSENRQLVTISHEGTEVTLQPFFQETTDVEVVALVRATGFGPISLRDVGTVSYHKLEIGIGKLSETDPVPSVLIGGYTGGAHCCATLTIITPSAGKLKTFEFEPVDGGPESSFPKDIDDDGTVDFVRQDDNFRYEFSSGAGSFSPPKFLNIYKGQLIDVSDQPSYRQQWTEFANKVKARCADRKDTDRNGACIAFAAAGARLGQYSAYLKEAVANAYSGTELQLPEGCEVALVDFQCPAGKEIKFGTFETAANWFLQQHGYIK